MSRVLSGFSKTGRSARLDTGSSNALFVGYLVAAALMVFGAIVELWIGVAAERRPLEHVAAPLSSRN